MPQQTFLHLGIHKTGSTFLQHKVFPRLAGVHYVGPGKHADPETFAIFDELTTANPAYFDVARVRDTFAEKRAAIKESKILVSSEELFGHLLWNFLDNRFIAEALAEIVPDARVVIFLRRQDDWAESAYKQTVRDGFTMPFNAFVGWNGSAFEQHCYVQGSRVRINVHQLDWLRYARTYADLFGAENLLVVPYELMQAEPKVFAARLSAFFGAEFPTLDNSFKVNPGFSKAGLAVARCLNRVFEDKYHEPKLIKQTPFHDYFLQRRDQSGFHRFMTSVTGRMTVPRFIDTVVTPLFPQPAALLSDTMRSEILRMHAERNRILCEEFGVGLSAFGYY